MADTLIKAACGSNFSAQLTADLGLVGLTNPTLAIALETALNSTLTPTSSPLTATRAFATTLALVAGAKTLDLTALDRGNLPDLDLTGLTIKHVVIYNPAATNLTIAKGATNGYFIFGATASTITLPPYFFNHFGVHNITGAGALAAVSSTVKTIDFTGTGTTSFQIGLIA